MLALERSHIGAKTILVEQAVAYGKLKLQKTGRVYRTVDLLDAPAEDLAVWLEHLPAARRFLFGREDDALRHPYNWNNWRKRHFHAVTRALDLGRPRPYDLRHSFASPHIREHGVSLVDLAASSATRRRRR
jgi:integrase